MSLLNSDSHGESSERAGNEADRFFDSKFATGGNGSEGKDRCPVSGATSRFPDAKGPVSKTRKRSFERSRLTSGASSVLTQAIGCSIWQAVMSGRRVRAGD